MNKKDNFVGIVTTSYTKDKKIVKMFDLFQIKGICSYLKCNLSSLYIQSIVKFGDEHVKENMKVVLISKDNNDYIVIDIKKRNEKLYFIKTEYTEKRNKKWSEWERGTVEMPYINNINDINNTVNRWAFVGIHDISYWYRHDGKRVQTKTSLWCNDRYKTVRAEAKCSPYDEFDMNTGLAIALGRLMVKRLKMELNSKMENMLIGMNKSNSNDKSE